MKKSLILLSISVLSMNLYADTDEASKKSNVSETVVKKATDESADKADELITNRRFRASNGSLSKLSMNTQMSYNGGSIDKPFAADRPNVSNAGDTTSIAGISGSLNATYRLNKLNRINFGAGLQMLAPFNDSIQTSDPRAQKEFDNNRGELDVANPRVSFTHMNKFFGVQTILNAGYTQYTASNLRDIGYLNKIGGSINTMYDFGGSKFSVGVLGVFDRNFFDNDSAALKKNQAETVWGFLPQAEYVINDKFNLRTIIRSNWYQNDRAGSPTDFTQRPITQSVGLGISVNRDVFLYPNVQFVHSDLQLANTNIGFTANINMF